VRIPFKKRREDEHLIQVLSKTRFYPSSIFSKKSFLSKVKAPQIDFIARTMRAQNVVGFAALIVSFYPLF
jgi:hypothetical protein